MRTENVEFIALFEASGWSEADAARQLDTTRASVNRYLSGKLSPKKSVIKLFKLILASEQPGALTAAQKIHDEDRLAEWERKVIDDLRWLRADDRDRALDILRAFIKGLPKREPISYHQSRKGSQAFAADVAQKLLEDRAAKASQAATTSEQNSPSTQRSHRRISPQSIRPALDQEKHDGDAT